MLAGLEHIIEQRVGRKTLGFTAEVRGAEEKAQDDLLALVRPEDLDAGGMETVFPWRRSDGFGESEHSRAGGHIYPLGAVAYPDAQPV